VGLTHWSSDIFQPWRQAVARNRYGWEKRVKEIARKQKHDEKIKRRQGKGRAVTEENPAPEAEAEAPEISNADNPGEVS
jgi:hypothetical protein